MYYHNILHNDMMNGPGLRAVLFVSGCEHHCKGCQNPQTWEPTSGIPFDSTAKLELFNLLDKDYISGITISGGDPLATYNLKDVSELVEEIRKIWNNRKSIWIYTGYTYDNLKILEKRNSYLQSILNLIDGLVDGEYIEELRDVSLPWVGSSNQIVHTTDLPYVQNNPDIINKN